MKLLFGSHRGSIFIYHSINDFIENLLCNCFNRSLFSNKMETNTRSIIFYSLPLSL